MKTKDDAMIAIMKQRLFSGIQCLLLGAAVTSLTVGVFAEEAAAAEDYRQGIVSSADAMMRAWEQAVLALPARAKSAEKPMPEMLDLTLPKCLDGSDLELQLVGWNGTYVTARSWREKSDTAPREVGIKSQSQEGDKKTVVIEVLLPGVVPVKPKAKNVCTVTLTMSVSNGSVTGTFQNSGLESKPLPIPSAGGDIRGRVLAAGGGGLRKPNLVSASKDGSARDYYLISQSARSMFQECFVLDRVVATGASRDGALLVFERDLLVPVVDVKEPPEEGTSLPTLSGGGVGGDGGLGKGGLPNLGAPALPGAAPKKTAAVKIDSETEAGLRLFGRVYAQVVDRLQKWAAGFGRPLQRVDWDRIAAVDPEFSPWFGIGALPHTADQKNVLPTDASPEGEQRWRYVRNWEILGPFPADGDRPVDTAFPSFISLQDASYRTDPKRLGMTKQSAPLGTNIVQWVALPEDVEEGLQRPWTRLAEGKEPQYIGPYNCFSYARTEIHAPKEMTLWVVLGADDYTRLWVNDELVSVSEGAPEVPERLAFARVTFRKGPNQIRVRLDNLIRRSGNREEAQRSGKSHFWMRVAVNGAPLDAVAVKKRSERIQARQAQLRNLPEGVEGYRNNNTGFYPGARPVTAWNLDKGINVLWHKPLMFEARGGSYGRSIQCSKSPPLIIGDRVIIFREPHVVLCLDKMTGKTLWERSCNVLEFTAPDKVAQAETCWKEYAAALDALVALGGWRQEHVETLVKRGMTQEAAEKEVDRLEAEWRRVSDRKEETFWKIMIDHGEFGTPDYLSWTGFSYGAPVTDGKHIWVKFGTGVAACFDLEGNRKWMSKIEAAGGFSVCPSPLLVGGTLVVQTGLPKEIRPDKKKVRPFWEYSCVTGLDAVTGKQLWQSGPIFNATLTGSPVAMKITDGAKDMDVILTEGGALLRVSDGKIMAQPWLMDAGFGSPVVDGATVYFLDSRLSAWRPVLHGRDTIGLRRLWMMSAPADSDNGMAIVDGTLYSGTGGQGPAGYLVFDTNRREILRFEGMRDDVWRGVPPQVNGRQYVPASIGGEYVFLGQHGSAFGGREPHGAAVCGVMQRRWDGMLVAQNRVKRTWTAPPVFDGDRTYIRIDHGLYCIGYTGEEGRAYEANVNAHYMMPNLEVAPPRDMEPVEIKQLAFDQGNRPRAFSRFMTYPVQRVGHFATDKADAALSALGGAESACLGLNPKSFPLSGFDTNLVLTAIEGCHMYGLGATEQNQHFDGVGYGTSAYFRVTFKTETERIVRCWVPHEPAYIWINGQRVEDGTRVKLPPGTYGVLARVDHTEEQPAPQGVYFRFDDATDLEAERKRWRDETAACRDELVRIAKYCTHPPHVKKAKEIIALKLWDEPPR